MSDVKRLAVAAGDAGYFRRPVAVTVEIKGASYGMHRNSEQYSLADDNLADAGHVGSSYVQSTCHAAAPAAMQICKQE
jgi:hypothetical protein